MDSKIILILNPHAFGDALIGTHAAKFIKKLYPDSQVVFCLNSEFNLTTASKEERQKGLWEALEILELQEGIDDVGIMSTEFIATKRIEVIEKPFKMYIQSGWHSNLNIVKSMLAEVAEEIGWNNINTELQFSVGVEVPKRPVFTIATSGSLDWTRKLRNTITPNTLFNYVKTLIPEAEVVALGRDVSNMSYLESLRVLKSCHLFIGPLGSLATAAAGLGVDVISISDVFPAALNSPEFYHSGNHHSVIAKNDKHCKSYKCTRAFPYKKGYKHVGTPPIEYDFWTMTCDYMPDGKSCIANLTDEDVIEKIDLWFKRSKYSKERI